MRACQQHRAGAVKIRGCQASAVRVCFEGVMPGTHIVLRLRTDEGLEGISYVSRVTPQNLRPLQLLIEAMVESLAGQEATATEAIYARLYQSVLGAPVSGLELRAASAIDVAAWDLKGKALGQPVYKLMGGARDRVPVSANWRLMPGPPPDEIGSHIQDVLRRGFKALKCPVGFVALDRAIEHVRFVRQCAGPEVKIIVDGNFRWTVKEALRFARDTEDCDLYWIEDPVAYHDYEGLKQITRSIKQPTCAGEVFQHVHEFRRLLEWRCANNVMIDQDLGLSGFLRVAHIAESYGCPVINHLAPEVLSHGIAAVPNGLIVGLVPWGQPLFVEPLKIENGELVMPQAPGLGLTLDEEVLKSCAV
jgi:L-alanine-DL-glutamate epimerase-like enolase superfamily enzyme